jgi:tetratricopeptide (TPR) repeat protein
MHFRIFLFLCFYTITIFAQEVNITPQLKLIEGGDFSEALEQLQELKKSNPNDPSVLFLEGVLTDDGNKARESFEKVYRNFPNSNYADASLYRLFSFSYSLGAYKKAEEIKLKLVNEYPNSPYIKAVNRNLPDENLNVAVSANQSDKTIKPTDNNPTAKFSIQAGAFLNVDNARKLNETFKSKGYYSKIFPKEIGGSILNVVIVGKFASKTTGSRKVYTFIKK